MKMKSYIIKKILFVIFKIKIGKQCNLKFKFIFDSCHLRQHNLVNVLIEL